MAVYFFDSSALFKRYAMEAGTSWVKAITDPAAAHKIHIAQVTLVEIVAALARCVREGKISTTEAATAVSQFRYDFDNQYIISKLTSRIIDHASTLPEIYKLRAYDAIQLAIALEVNAQSRAVGMAFLGVPALIVVSADGDLNAAATAEGLAVDNPMNHP